MSKAQSRKEDAELKIDPVYHGLSRINGEINRMSKCQLQHLLTANGLNDRGVKEVLRKRLKNFYKKQKLHSKPGYVDTLQYYPFLIVVDFEATCEEKNPADYLHEIIEFPAVLLDTSTCQIVDTFHRHCRPTLNPNLSAFCTSLTGINQDCVDRAPTFDIALTDFEAWLKQRDLHLSGSCAFVTDGSWDFSRFLNIQCCLSEIKYPRWAKKWINLKKVYGNFYDLHKPRMAAMLENIGLQFEGRLHCGKDDAHNLARIVQRMLEDGAKFQVNEKLHCGKLQVITEKERALLSSRVPKNSEPQPKVSDDREQASDVDEMTSSLQSLSLPSNGQASDPQPSSFLTETTR